MSCHHCVSNPIYNSLCKECFLHDVHRKVRKIIRKECPLKRGQTLSVPESVNRDLLIRIVTDALDSLNLQFSTKNSERSFVPYSCEDVGNYLLEQFFSGTFGSDTSIYPLKSCTNEELKIYAQFINIPFRPMSHEVDAFVGPIQKKYPQTISSLRNSHDALRDL